MNKEQIDAVTYLKKQIREEIERYKIAVKIHGHEKASKTLHIQINLDEGQAILDSEKAHAPKSDTFDKVVEILSVLHGFDRYEISGSDHLKNDLGLDSLDVVELEMELEKEFNFLVDDQVWSDIQDWCVDEVVVNVEKNMK